MNSILTHSDGYNLIKSLSLKYDNEIECLCLNSQFLSVSEMEQALNKYKQLVLDFPQIIVLKESEFHENEFPYYEMSLFCDKKDVDKFELILAERGIKIDLIHSK